MSPAAALAAFWVGTILSQYAGSYAYSRTRTTLADRKYAGVWAAIVAGIITALVATVAYRPLRLDVWMGGEDAAWGAAAFGGICLGVWQGVLNRDRLAQAFAKNKATSPNSDVMAGPELYRTLEWTQLAAGIGIAIVGIALAVWTPTITQWPVPLLGVLWALGALGVARRLSIIGARAVPVRLAAVLIGLASVARIVYLLRHAA